MMNNMKIKELHSQDKASGTTHKGKPSCAIGRVMGSQPILKNMCKLVGSSSSSDAYQKSAPTFQSRNARLTTVSKNCSVVTEKVVNHEQLCGGSSLILRSGNDSLVPAIEGLISYDDVKAIRRKQYVTNKRVKRSLKSKPVLKSRKGFKEHKNKQNVTARPQSDFTKYVSQAYGDQTNHRDIFDMTVAFTRTWRQDSIESGDLWFHLEKLVSVIQLLRHSTSKMDTVHILNLYLGIYFKTSVVDGFLILFEECIIKIKTCQSSGMDVFKSLLNNWQSLKDSEAARQIYHFISTVLATGLCSMNNIKMEFKGLEIFRIVAAKKVANLMDLFQVIIETAVFFYERGCAYLASNNLWDLLYSDQNLVVFEKEYAFVIANKPHAIVSEWPEMGMSCSDYFALMAKLTDELLTMIKVSTGAERNALTSKLVLLEKTKIEVRRANVAPSMRMKPFGTVLFGGSGVGKTSVLPYIIHYLNVINGFESTKERVVTLNPAEKYQSEYKCNTNVVIIDDIMNQKLEVSEGSPGDLIIRLLNNIPAAALKAEVESKGNVMMEPNFVYGTTNVKSLCAHQLSNEPVSILRRFEYFITMTVKDEYKRGDSDMLDSSKITQGTIPNAWWFKVEYVIPTDVHEGHAAKPTFKVAVDDGRPLDKIDFQRLLDFLGHQSKCHFVEQKAYVSGSADIYKMEVCGKCHQLGDFCKCKLAEQHINECLWPKPIDAMLDIVTSGHRDDQSSSLNSGITVDDRLDAELDELSSLIHNEQMQVQTKHWLQEGWDDFFHPDNVRARKGAKIKSKPTVPVVVEDVSDSESVNDDDIARALPSLIVEPEGLSDNDLRRLILGKDLPKKTHVEFVRDKVISKMLGSPFIKEFISGDYNAFASWSSVCLNFLIHKWKFNKADCLYFMILLILNTIIITLVTVPLIILSKIGLVSIGLVDRSYEYAAHRITHVVLSGCNLSSLRKSKVASIQRNIKLSLYGVSLLSILYMVRRSYKAYRVYTNQALSEGGPVPADEKHKVDHWAPVTVSKIAPSLKSSTTTSDQLLQVVNRTLGSATLVCKNTGRRSQTVIFPLCNNIWIVNAHALTGYAQNIDVVVRKPGTIGTNFSDIVGLNNSYILPDNDLALVVLSRGGSQYDFTEYFPYDKESVRYMCTIMYKGLDADVTTQRVLARPKAIQYQGPVGVISINGFHYTTQLPTFEGMCMSPLITYDSKPQIVGFHCCGVSGSNEGGAALLTQLEIKGALLALKSRRGLMVAHSACPNGLNFEDIGPYPTVKMSGEIHKKSPFRFIPDGSFDLYGQTDGPRQSQESAVVHTLLSDAVSEVFGIPCIWGPPENLGSYIPKRAEVLKMSAVKAMDPDIMALAAHDFCSSIIDQLPEVKLKGIGPLGREQILSGQDGVSQLRAVVMSTSAGFPINKPKHKILSRTGISSDFVTDVITAPDWIWDRVEKCEQLLLNGKRCHFVYKASLKDEPKKIGSGKVRVFAGVSLEGLLIVRKYFLPLGIIIMRNPFEFESAVGINAHGKDWDNFVKHVTRKGSNRMIAGDYASFDSSMSPTASMAAFSCLIHLARRCNYTEDDIQVMIGIATEICYPTYDFFGEIVVVNGTGPSGHPMTVFINNLVNSLYIRYAYYCIYSFDKNNYFNKYVTQMNYGDDNVMSVSEERQDFNHTAIQAELGKSGVTYTMADKEGVSIPFIKMEDCSFLKRSFRLDPVHELYLGPLESMSLFKTLHTCVKSDNVSLELQNCDMVSSVLFEAFLHGKDFYDDFRRKLTKVLEKCSVVYWYPKGLPTFDHQQEVWDKRYLEEDNGGCENPHGSGVVGDSYIFE